jgi:hypothetical protein
MSLQVQKHLWKTLEQPKLIAQTNSSKPTNSTAPAAVKLIEIGSTQRPERFFCEKNMRRYIALLVAGVILVGCEEQKAPFPKVDLHGRLVVDQAMTEQRKAQGIEGDYLKRVLTVDGKDIDFAEFIKTYCEDQNSREESCQKAFRIKKIDDVSGASKFLPNGL